MLQINQESRLTVIRYISSQVALGFDRFQPSGNTPANPLLNQTTLRYIVR